MQQAELHAATLESPADLTAYMSKSSHDLHEILAKVATPLGMQKFAWNAWTEAKLAGCPRDDVPERKMLGWRRRTNGFEGNVLAELDDGKPWVELGRVHRDLGKVIFAQQQLRQLL